MTNFFAARMPVGTRVSWTREMYRVPIAKRPTDYGVVVEHVEPRGDYIVVRDEQTGKTIRGPAACFSIVPATSEEAPEMPSTTNPFEQHLAQEQDDQLREALRSLDAAEAEISNIRTQLVEAAAGRPYFKVGTVYGVDAGKVFAAFGTIETLAKFRKLQAS